MKTDNTTSREERYVNDFRDWRFKEDRQLSNSDILDWSNTWWLKEFNSLLDELLSEVGEKKKYVVENFPEEEGYNQALDDVRSIINHKKLSTPK